MMNSFDDFLKEMENISFQYEYNALQPDYAIVQAF